MDTHVDISVTAREQIVDLPDLWQTIRLPARIQCAGPSQLSYLKYCELYVLISIYFRVGKSTLCRLLLEHASITFSEVNII